ncbi:MAG: MFS transporter, partial [Nitrospiria bacterium]
FWPYVLLPVFLQDLGADLAQVGIIMGTASLSGILIRPGIGFAIDGIGRRICLLSGGVIFLLANLSYLWINQVGWGIYGARLLHGFGMGILTATFFTLAADIAPVSRRTEGIGLFGISGHLSGAIGVFLGEQFIRLGGYSLFFKGCAGFAGLSILASLYIREPRRNLIKTPVGGVLRAALQRSVRIPLAATLCFALGLTSYMVFLKPFALSVELGFVTYFFLTYSLSAVTIRLVCGDWPDRFGLKRILYPSLVLLAVGIISISLRPSPAGLVMSGMLCGIGHGFIFPILSVLIIGRARDANRGGLMMSLFTLFFDIGIFIGAPFWGLIAKWYGYQIMFFTASAIILISLVSFLILDKDGRTSS